METLTDVVQLDLVPLVAATLKETARLTAAVEGLAREVDQLTAEGRRAPGHEPAARRAPQPARLPLRAEVDP